MITNLDEVISKKIKISTKFGGIISLHNNIAFHCFKAGIKLKKKLFYMFFIKINRKQYFATGRFGLKSTTYILL